jgi:hypothetical protein
MKRFLALFLSCLLLVNTTLAGIALAADEVLFYHTDNFGTPVAMTDAGGKVIWRADELPFGEEYKIQQTVNCYKKRPQVSWQRAGQRNRPHLHGCPLS